MSTLEERRIALTKAKRLLEKLALSDSESGIPDSIRRRAQEALRHLPHPHDVVDIVTVWHEYATSMAQADDGQALGLEMAERAKESTQRAQDMKTWLVIAASLSAAVAFTVSAGFTAAYTGAMSKAILLALGALGGGAIAVMTAVSWLRGSSREVESSVDEDLRGITSSAWRRPARRLERQVPLSRDFGPFPKQEPKQGDDDERE